MKLLPYAMPLPYTSGLLFHIMVRGNNKQEIYLDSNDYEEFLAAEAAFLGCHPSNIIRAL
jgi:hypothetical protein